MIGINLDFKHFVLVFSAFMLFGCNSRQTPLASEITKSILNEQDIGLGVDADNSANYSTPVFLTFFLPNFEYGKDAVTVPDRTITLSFGSKKFDALNVSVSGATINDNQVSITKLNTTDYQIRAPLDRVQFGKDNTLTLVIRPKFDTCHIYKNDFYFRVGTFYPVINVTAQATKPEGDKFNVNFIITNKGKVETIPNISFRLRSNFEDVLEISEVYPAQDTGLSDPGQIRTFENIEVRQGRTYVVTYKMQSNSSDWIYDRTKFKDEGLMVYPSYIYIPESEIDLPSLLVADKSTFKIHCQTDDDCQGSRICLNDSCENSQMHIAFVPVNWDLGQLAEFNLEADQQAQFLLNSWPSLDSCRNKVKVTKLNISYDFTINPNGSITDLNGIKDFATRIGKTQKYSFVIGISETNEFSGNTVGYTWPPYIMDTAFMAKSSWLEKLTGTGSEVTAHELGHLFSLRDQYCYQPERDPYCGGTPNPISKDYGCDPTNISDDCCWTDINDPIFNTTIFDSCNFYPELNVSVCCQGNKNKFGGRSIMSYANAQGPRYFDEPSLQILERNEKLNCSEG